MLIRKVFWNKSNQQLLITIPKNVGIGKGDYIKLIKIEEE